MIVSLVKIECKNIHDRDSFHDEFMRVFGFPDFYGRNLNAWIDCMSSLAFPEDEMSKIHCEKGKTLTIHFNDSRELKENLPDIYDEIVECAACVNSRRIGVCLELSFDN